MLAGGTGADVSDEAFPFRAVAQLQIGYATVTAIRITYVGELGYELYIPTEQVCTRQILPLHDRMPIAWTHS